jgi:hypothetical protein
VCFARKLTVLHVCREAKNEKEEGAKVFLPPRKHINCSKRVTNLNDFEKDILYRTVFEYCSKGEFLTVKKATFALREKTVHKCSFHVLFNSYTAVPISVS